MGRSKKDRKLWRGLRKGAYMLRTRVCRIRARLEESGHEERYGAWQRRLGGMATVLETRLRQTQAEAMAPIDLIVPSRG